MNYTTEGARTPDVKLSQDELLRGAQGPGNNDGRSLCCHALYIYTCVCVCVCVCCGKKFKYMVTTMVALFAAMPCIHIHVSVCVCVWVLRKEIQIYGNNDGRSLCCHVRPWWEVHSRGCSDDVAVGKEACRWRVGGV